MGDKLRLALVGCGAISEWHRMGIRNVPEIEIVAAVDVERARAEAAAAEYGAAVFTSLEDALARGELQHFMDHHPRGKFGQVIYDLKGDFGVDPADLRRRFDFYFERFPVRPEN